MSQSDQVHNSEPILNYWQLFQDLPESYILFEADEPHKIVELNKAREALLGVARSDVIGKPLFTVHPPVGQWYQGHAKNHAEELIQEVLHTHKAQSYDALRYDLRGADGVIHTKYWQSTYVPLALGSKHITHILAVTKDVTREHTATSQMARTEKRLEVALTAGKVGSWMWALDSDTITFDATVATVLGLPHRHGAASVPRASLRDAVYRDDWKRMGAALKAVSSGKQALDEEFRLRTRTGKIRWVLVRGQLEVDDGLRRVVGVIIDITEQHDLQAQVRLAREQDKLNRQVTKVLQGRNQELEAIARTKDEFVALASHQLRTPATAVKQYLGMVLQGYVGDISDVQTEMLNKAFESNERQIQIINQILNAARADTGRLVLTPGPVDISALVRGVANDMKSMFDAHHHKLYLKVPKTPLQVEGDLGYLRMAIENLVNNAIVYTPDGGDITISLIHKGKQCRILVTDTGVGIRKADIQKLFIKFSRIHNPLSVQAGGSGIGLYLVAEILRLHKGSIEVESRIGKGTTFAISLPLVQNTTH